MIEPGLMRPPARQPLTFALWCLASLVLRSHDASAQSSGHANGLRDCLGKPGVVAIRPGYVGALPLHLSLNEIRQRCSQLTWSTVNGDEELDTAIVLTRPGIRVMGAVAVLGDEDGFHRPVHVDGRRTVRWWQVSGSAGVLPRGLPLDATWKQARHAYGPLSASALNGIVYVSVCRQPGLTLLMDIPSPEATINGASPAVIDSVMATARIHAVLVAAVAPRTTATACGGNAGPRLPSDSHARS